MERKELLSEYLRLRGFLADKVAGYEPDRTSDCHEIVIVLPEYFSSRIS